MNILSYFIHALQLNLWNILFKYINTNTWIGTAGPMPIYVLSMQHLISWTNTTMKRQKFGVQWIIFPLIYSVIHTQNKDIDSTPLNRILKILLSSESHGFFKVILTHRLLYSLRLKWTRISFYHFYCSIKTLKSTQQHFLNQSFVRNKNINFLYNSYDQSHIIINPNQVQIKQKTKVKVTRG